MNRLRGRIGVKSAEVDEPSVKIVSRKHFNRFFGSHAVADQSNIISKRAQLDRPPRNPLDHARNFLRAQRDYVANLKWPIGMKRNSREEIAERVLKRETDDHSEDCGSGEERAEIYFRVNLIKDKDKNDREEQQRENVADERRGFVTSSKSKQKIKEERVDDADTQVDEQ